MLSLLQNVEAISSCRDRGRLPRVLSQAVHTLLGEAAGVGVFVRETQADEPLRVMCGMAVADAAVPHWLELMDDVRRDGSLKTRTIAGRNCGALALPSSELSSDQMVLVYDVDQGDPTAQADSIACLARIYGCQIRLLDYSELDTLTRLLNRKTFDETFDRLLTSPGGIGGDGLCDERRGRHEASAPAWLCVVDVDHFKRVNDSFGHLFGDEVLLRIGELMRRTFRSGDRLFRFGGEEFVVILNAGDKDLAAASFDRFRCSVESHEFPQVGKVTCSIGFTEVSGMDVPTDVVGRADEALYFAKENGRNQVRCYEELVADGLITSVAATRAPAEGDFDIDALFG